MAKQRLGSTAAVPLPPSSWTSLDFLGVPMSALMKILQFKAARIFVSLVNATFYDTFLLHLTSKVQNRWSFL